MPAPREGRAEAEGSGLDLQVTPVLADGALVAVRVTFQQTGVPRPLDPESGLDLEAVCAELRSTVEEMDAISDEFHAIVTQLEARIVALSTSNEQLEARNERLQSANAELRGINRRLRAGAPAEAGGLQSAESSQPD